MIRKDVLENLKITGQNEVKNDRGKERIAYLFSKWMPEQGLREINEKNIKG